MSPGEVVTRVNTSSLSRNANLNKIHAEANTHNNHRSYVRSCAILTLQDAIEMNKIVQRIDPLTPEQRRYTMAQVHSKDTKPEMRVRRLAHRLGYRYRLHRKDLPGKPDLTFSRRKKIIFVHGCFWHGHDCPAGRKRPQTNQEYWTRKLERTRQRDVDNEAKLRELGWDALIIWECQTKDEDALAEVLTVFLDNNVVS